MMNESNILADKHIDQIKKESFTDPNLIYDYNEVQELFFDMNNKFIGIVGHTGLRKSILLKKMILEMVQNGVPNDNIIFLDMHIPNSRKPELIYDFINNHTSKNSEQPLYMFIDEIWKIPNLALFLNWLKDMNVKMLSTCSMPHIFYEIQENNQGLNIKTVVLSQKNNSNIKHEQVTFGTYRSLKYNIKNGVCEIKGLTKEGKSKEFIEIPSEIDGFPVKIIASGAFHHRLRLTKIVLPNTVEFIGDYAFTHCENLNSIHLPDNLRHIGDCAFLGAKSLKVIKNGKNVTHIGNSALMGTQWLAENNDEYIVLGKTLYKYTGSVGSVKKLTLPDNVHVIGFYAFSYSKFESIDLNNCKVMNEGAFFNCSNLKHVESYKIRNVPSFTFYNCESLETKFISIESVGKFAFHGCKYLETIDFKDAVIGHNAFEDCLRLKTLYNPLIKVGVSAFYNANIINCDLRLLKYVEAYAFHGTILNSINAGQVNFIGDYAFSNIKTLKEVDLNNTAEIGKGIFMDSNQIDKAAIGGRYKLRSLFMEEPNIKELSVFGYIAENFSRNNHQLTKLTINSDQIGPWAFYNNVALEQISLKVNNLGPWCFAYCDKLTKIELPDTVKYVSMNSFRYCSQLKNIVLRSSDPVRFGANAFYSTHPEKTFYVPNKNAYSNLPVWNDYYNQIKEIQLQVIEKGKFTEYHNPFSNQVEKIEVNLINSVDKSMMLKYKYLKEIVIIADSLHIGDWTFYNFKGLESVTVKANHLTIGHSAFYKCLRLTFLNLPSDTQFMGKRIFAKSISLIHFDSPSELKYIPEGTFNGCESLINITLNTEIISIDQKAFQFCKNLQYIRFNHGLRKIGSKAFSGCSSLKLVYLPNTLEVVKEDVFEACNNIISVLEHGIPYNIIDNILKKSINKVLLSRDIQADLVQFQKEYYTALGKEYYVEIDRPIGSTHPKHPEIIYPINYGYVPNLIGGDGEEQDVYVLDLNEPVDDCYVIIIGIVFRFDDHETKWVGVVNKNNQYTQEEIKSAINFQEQFYEIMIFN